VFAPHDSITTAELELVTEELPASLEDKASSELELPCSPLDEDVNASEEELPASLDDKAISELELPCSLLDEETYSKLEDESSLDELSPLLLLNAEELRSSLELL
jgi:hypothetical protein